jgi:hypothetical protein
MEEVHRRVQLALGSSAHLCLELFLGGLARRSADNVLVKIATIAVLLKNEGTGYTGPEASELKVLQPDMSVRHKVWVGELGKQLDLDENLFKPGMVVSNRDSFAGKLAQWTAVNLVAHK